MATNSTKKVVKKSKVRKVVPKGIISIQSTFNNTIISVSDTSGNVLAWATAGSAGFKGARKSTPYAAQTAMLAVLDRVKAMSMVEASVHISGVGTGRESAIRALGNSGIDIVAIKDLTPIAHNGVRAKKPRRV
ncbi:MAG: 30S ribosomal protein S11 [Patescibacteria group bacterium]|jgi:small subunit ribosomal protein S11